jgi:hypothetical protein
VVEFCHSPNLISVKNMCPLGVIKQRNGGEKVRKVILTLVLMAGLLCTVAAHTFAAAPTIVEDVWFVIPVYTSSTNTAAVPLSFTADKVWSSGDGTVLHSRSTSISTYVARSPPGAAGTVRIGTVTAVSDFVFNTESEKGTLNMKLTIVLTTSNNVNYPNPYGVGTLEGTLVAEVTSLNPYVSADVCPLPGDAQGFFVATHGTGAFEKAKLDADVTMSFGTVVAGSITIGIEYMFFGHHINHLYNEGTLSFHNQGISK